MAVHHLAVEAEASAEDSIEGSKRKNMKLMFVSTECAPFIKTGGLGDVIGALPISLRSELEDEIVVIPLFKKVKEKYFKDMSYVGEVNFTMSWRKQMAKIYLLESNNVKYYFVENDYYFIEIIFMVATMRLKDMRSLILLV